MIWYDIKNSCLSLAMAPPRVSALALEEKTSGHLWASWLTTSLLHTGCIGWYQNRTEHKKKSALMSCFLDFLKSTQWQVIYRQRNRKRHATVCARGSTFVLCFHCGLMCWNLRKCQYLITVWIKHMNKLFLRCLWAKGSVCVLYICLLHYKCIKLSAQVHWK